MKQKSRMISVENTAKPTLQKSYIDWNVTDELDLILMSLALFGDPGQTAPVAPPISGFG